MGAMLIRAKVNTKEVRKVLFIISMRERTLNVQSRTLGEGASTDVFSPRWLVEKSTSWAHKFGMQSLFGVLDNMFERSIQDLHIST